MEATGRDAAALAGHGLAELREAKLCPRPGSNGRTIEARPLYARNGRRRHWLVVQHETAPQPAAAPGGTAEPTAGSDDFRSLVEHIGNGVLVHRDFRALYANAACARRIGFEDGAELLREPTLLPFLPVEMHRLALRRHARLLAGEARKRV